jgi:hypothetical protein
MIQETQGVSRRRLLKRVAIGGGVVYAAPFMTSTALAGPDNGHPRCNALPGESVKTCGPSPCGAEQTDCRGAIPEGSFCTCVPREPGSGNETGEGQCFCHEVQFCADIEPCENTGDCPPGWACTSSCCAPGSFCLPPCGTNPMEAGSLSALVALAGSTSAG